MPVLRARQVRKRYGTLEALSGVDLDVLGHRVHALVGENGAGKSTLAKILTGVICPDEGSLELSGRARVLTGRADALRRGIGLVPQTLSLIGELTLVENHLLGVRTLRARRASARRALAATADRAGLSVPLDMRTRDLSLAERQLGELLLALTGGARVLILDEPTSSLGPVEVGGLFAHLRRLTDEGAAIVIITHRVDEVRRIADEVTVLCRGRVVHHSALSDVTDTELAVAMVGGDLPASPRRTTPETSRRTVGEPGDEPGGARRAVGPTRLEVAGLTSPGAGGTPIRGVDLTVSGGEILGVIGVAGSGQAALADAIAGLVPVASGTVAVDGVPVTGSAPRATGAGLGYITERRADGLLPSRTVADNAALLRTRDPELRRLGMRHTGAVEGYARDLVRRFDVRPPEVGHPVDGLSGGNQQKLLSGRELDHGSAVVLAHGPTQGLDGRAAEAVRAGLTAAAGRGAAVLLISADLDEVRALADRILVLVHGNVVDAMTATEATTERIGRSMAGLTMSDETQTDTETSTETSTEISTEISTETDAETATVADADADTLADADADTEAQARKRPVS